MNIALVTPEFITENNFDGGLSNYIYRLSLSLLQIGHTPIVYLLSDENDRIIINGFEVVKIKKRFINQRRFLEQKGIYKYFFKSFFIIFDSYIVNKKINLDHKKKSIDIIQFAHLGALALFSSSKIPCVIRMSSYTPLINKAFNKPGGIQQNFWEQLAIRKCGNVFSPSKIISNIESKIIKKEVRVIESPFIKEPLNFDYDIFNEKIIGKEYFLFFGSLNLLKGIETIGYCLERIFQEFSSKYFVFVGKDQGIHGISCYEFLKKQAKEYQDKIIYIDKIPHNKLYPIIQNAKLVILPSRIDNFPNTCIEAMAFKKIVIGTIGTSFEQLIDHGKNGFLISVDDSDHLFSTIKDVMNLPILLTNDISENAFQRIKKLQPEIVVAELINYYEQVIIDRKRG